MKFSVEMKGNTATHRPQWPSDACRALSQTPLGSFQLSSVWPPDPHLHKASGRLLPTSHCLCACVGVGGGVQACVWYMCPKGPLGASWGPVTPHCLLLACCQSVFVMTVGLLLYRLNHHSAVHLLV